MLKKSTLITSKILSIVIYLLVIAIILEVQMRKSGCVYILENKCLDGIIKIGATDRDAATRAEELSSATGVPLPFTVKFSLDFDDCWNAEKTIHSILTSRGERVSDNREFFYTDTNTAIHELYRIQSALAGADGSHTADPCEEIEHFEEGSLASEYYTRGLMHLEGRDDYLQDYKEALLCFNIASNLDYPLALEKIGDMNRFGYGVPVSREAALEFYKKSLKMGNKRCYASMAYLYLDKDSDMFHRDNGRKCWNNYFNISLSDSLESTGNLDIFHLRNYISYWKNNQVKPSLEIQEALVLHTKDLTEFITYQIAKYSGLLEDKNSTLELKTKLEAAIQYENSLLEFIKKQLIMKAGKTGE